MKKQILLLINLALILASCHDELPDFDGNFPPDMEIIYDPHIEAFEGFIGDTLTVRITIDHEMIQPGKLTEINEIYVLNEEISHVRTIFEEDLNGLPSPLVFELSHVFKEKDIDKELEYGFEHKSRIIPKDGNGHLLRVGPRTLKVITKERLD